MTYAITHSEYLTIDGIPLSTPGWTTNDITSVMSGPPARGADLLIPGRHGQTVRQRYTDAREMTIQLTVYGDQRWDGAAYPDPRAGLLANLDHLKMVMLPNGVNLRSLAWHHPAGIRTASVHPSPAIDVAMVSPTVARITLTFQCPGGYLRGELVTTAFAVGSDTTVSLNVAGTGWVTDHSITTPGGTTTTLTNGNTGHSLIYPAASSGLVFGCGSVSLTGGAVGAVVTSQTPLWLPLAPGPNSIRLQLPGGSGTLTIAYRPAWL